jgi:hypothetical protein
MMTVQFPEKRNGIKLCLSVYSDWKLGPDRAEGAIVTLTCPVSVRSEMIRYRLHKALGWRDRMREMLHSGTNHE